MALPDLDCLIAEVDRRCDTAHRPGGQEQPDWLALLAVATQLAGEVQALADNLVEDYVEHCRMHGSSWTDIGAALGVTRQAVQQRFQAPHKHYSPETMTDDVRQAMVHVKLAAVQHRNNYMGTEHLLWGLTTQDTGAPPAPSSRRCLAGDAAPVRRSPAEHGCLPCSRASHVDALLSQGHRHRRGSIEHNGSERIGCEDLLIGLAQVGRGVAASVLT
jgi:hypothetical protein